MNCFSVVSGQYGERLFPHVVYEGEGFNVGEEFFSVASLGKVQTEDVETYKGQRLGLTSFNLFNVDYRGIVPRTVEVSNGERKNVAALVFLRGPKKKHMSLKNQKNLRTNLRTPMPIEYWKEITRIENLKDSVKIGEQKEALRADYNFDYILENKGCTIILPSRSKNASSYLVAMTPGSSFEWVLSRQSRNLANCYRLDCDLSGKVTLHDPRREARQIIR